MKKMFITLTMMLSLSLAVTHAHAELNDFLSSLNTRAHADIDQYGARLSVQFGVPEPEVRTILRRVASPADAFMCLQLGQMTRLPYDRVLRTYEGNRGRGWGVIAKDLGIKPGSSEFHALKRGDFVYNGGHGHRGYYDDSGRHERYDGGGKKGGNGNKHDKGNKGKGKGHNK